MSKRKEILRLLEENRQHELSRLAESQKGILRALISLTYDKEDIICWRAIETVGLAAREISGRDPAAARNLAQRLLWTMRDESGNNLSSSPEMLGEIVRNSPDEFSDIAPIIGSFHDEETLRRGTLRALVRIGEIRPDLVDFFSSCVGLYLSDGDAVVRAYAIYLAGILRLKEHIAALEGLLRDGSSVQIYMDGDFRTVTIGKIVEETVILMGSER